MSNLFNLNIKDVIKGIATAILASIVVAIYGAVTNNLAIDWNEILKIALSSGLGYIMKNYLSDANGKLLGKL